MKKFITLTALLLTLVTSFSFAADTTNGIGTEQANAAVKAAFAKDFRNSQIMTTEVHKNFTKLTFRMNEIVLFAFYSDNGDLLAVTRNIVSTQLPLSLQLSLKKNYSSYWISELFELNGEGQNAYYITLENADQKLTLRSSGDNWEVYQKSSKE